MPSSIDASIARMRAVIDNVGGVPGQVYFFVPGKAASQGSKSRNRHGAMFESDKGLPAWRRAVAGMAQVAMARTRTWDPFTEAEVELMFITRRPKNHYNSKGEIYPRFLDVKHTVKPDGDKLTRAVFDGLTQGGIIEDDARIWRHSVMKMYVTDHKPTNEPGCWVTIKGTGPASSRKA